MELKKYIKENQLMVMGVGIVVLVNLIGGLIYLNSKPKKDNLIEVVPTVTPVVLPTETMGPTETPEPTATGWPTDTPKPTATKIPTAGPTNTPSPVPTQTPGPTNTPVPVPSPWSQRYSSSDCSASGYSFTFPSSGNLTYTVTGPVNLEVGKSGGSIIFPNQIITNTGIIPISEAGTFNLSIGCTTGSGSWEFVGN